MLLQLSVISGALLLLAAPCIPFRLVLFFGGETLLFLGHPWARPLLLEASPYLQQSSKSVAIRVARLLEDDALNDAELESEILVVERFEVETRQDGMTWVPDVVIGGELPKGSKWLRIGDWSIDTTYNDGKIDPGKQSTLASQAPPFSVLTIHGGTQLGFFTCIWTDQLARPCRPRAAAVNGSQRNRAEGGGFVVHCAKETFESGEVFYLL